MLNLKRRLFYFKQVLEEERQKTRRLYVEFGFHSREYQEQFDSVHELSMKYEAMNYRSIHGYLANYGYTPYCEGPVTNNFLLKCYTDHHPF